MPSIAAVSKIDLPYKIAQEEVKRFATELFVHDIPQVEKLVSIFDNTEIQFRNLCKPLRTYAERSSFQENNKEYVRIALEYSVQAIQECLTKATIVKEKITDIIVVSSTGLATPSLDALIINRLRLNPHINRIPVFGLGCAGGVAGIAKASVLATANPDAIVLLVAVELCSLTFLKNDYSKSNFVASSLFSDGIAACIVMGDTYQAEPQIDIIGSRSKLYFDSLDVMGWEFLDSGFKVLFSQNIPAIIHKNIREDIVSFLKKHKLELTHIINFIFHPGGKKVLDAFAVALAIEGDCLKTTRETMNSYGNMSSTTVLYVLEQFLKQGFRNGYGLMLAMGPGFSTEMVLLKMKNN